jgi:hypothetical protein
MSSRTRTIRWIEGKIVEILMKRKEITTYLAMSACVLENVRSIEEQHNLDIALAHLLSNRQITKEQDQDGFTIFRMAA